MEKHEKSLQYAKSFGKVVVLMGGQSSERDISLKSGQAVLASLQRSGVDAHALDVDTNVVEMLTYGCYDNALIMLHGSGGEDGVIQGVLETLAINYTGSNVLGSALSMDKYRSKLVWQGHELPTPDFVIIDSQTESQSVIDAIGLPMIIKPADEGSSIGLTKVTTAGEFSDAYHAALKQSSLVFAEQWIDGDEYTAAILGQCVLPLIGIKTPHLFYDYDAKYLADDTNYICPCGLDVLEEENLKNLSMQAYQVLACSGWGRVDLMIDANKQPWLIEVNAVPGMTDHSLVPMAAKVAGIGFDELVLKILENTNECRSIF